MNGRFDEKPLKAEVIDMDRASKSRNRPSAIYTERVETATGSGPDDPGFRYLFDDLDDRDPRRNPGTMRRLSSLVLTVVIAMSSAWMVWAIPGFGPQQSHALLLQRLEASETRLVELESRLAQAQVRVIELTRAAEIQNELIHEGESLRRSMTSSLENLVASSRHISDAQAEAARRIDSLETVSKAQAQALRRHSDSIAGLDTAMLEGLTRVAFANDRLEQRLAELRGDTDRSLIEATSELTRIFRKELGELRQGELNEIRSRIERLASHVWQEVGRLDGRIVRVASSQDSSVEVQAAADSGVKR